MKKKLILIAGILIALIAIWQAVMGEPALNQFIKGERQAKQDHSIIIPREE